MCQCRYDIQDETGEWKRQFTCVKCSSEMDNLKTKTKMDQLRLVMQQCKQKREARKLRGAPYATRTSPVKNTAENASANGGTKATESMMIVCEEANSSKTSPSKAEGGGTTTIADVAGSSSPSASATAPVSEATSTSNSGETGVVGGAVAAETAETENNSIEVSNKSGGGGGGGATSSEVSPNHLAEEVDTAA